MEHQVAGVGFTGRTGVDLRPRRETVYGFEFDQLDGAGVIEYVTNELRHGRGGWMITPNVSILRQVSADPELAKLIERASLVIADGAPVEWAGRMSGRLIVPRAPGASLFWTLCAAAERESLPVLLLGGRPGSVEAAATTLRHRFPLIIVGTHFPPYGFESDAEQRSQIRSAVGRSAGGLVFVGLGFPKQEKLMDQLLREFPDTWFFGVGAAIDFAAGAVPRAPKWMQRAGLEWSFRLAVEPRRLARRYLVEDMPFAGKLARWAIEERFRSTGVPGSAPAVPALEAAPAPVAAASNVIDLRVKASAAQAASGATGPLARAQLRSVIASNRVGDADRARALDSLVDIMLREGNYGESADLLAQRLALPFASPTDRIVAQMRQSRCLMERGDIHEAVDAARLAVSQAEADGLGTTAQGVRLRVTYADLLRTRGDLATAELQIRIATDAADASGSVEAKGSALWNAALIAADQGRFEDARGLASSAGDIFQLVGDSLSLALVTVIEASVPVGDSAYAADAAERMRSAIATVEELGTVAQQACIRIHLARVDLTRGRQAEALLNVQVALAQLGDSNAIDSAAALSVKSQILAAKGDHEAALEAATKSAEILERAGAVSSARRVWAELGEVYWAMHNSQRAIECFRHLVTSGTAFPWGSSLWVGGVSAGVR
ncbi:MAG: WecB/TagA/CpsF family glycosyltransferase [Propionicimonas sp.]